MADPDLRHPLVGSDDDFDCQYCNISYWQLSHDDWIVKPRWEVAMKVTGMQWAVFWTKGL